MAKLPEVSRVQWSMMDSTVRIVMFLMIALLTEMVTVSVSGHDGPDPLISISSKSRFLTDDGVLKSQKGPDFHLGEGVAESEHKDGLTFSGRGTPYVKAPLDQLPEEAFTVASWFSVYKEVQYGGIIGAIEDNGNYEKGWVLGYGQKHFYIGLSSEGADDGDGHMTYLNSKTEYKKGVPYFVVATYDGKTLSLYVNGKLDTTSDKQSGKILYAPESNLAFAGYKDRDEDWRHQGEIMHTFVFDQTATAAWVKQEFEHNAELALRPAPEVIRNPPLTFVVAPYLQYGTTESMTVMWETSVEAEATVHYGETAECHSSIIGNSNGPIHEVTLKKLNPGTQYFYKVTSTKNGKSLTSEVKTFQTDGGKKVPYSFAIISDTQANPDVSGALAKLAWEHRPNFLLHPGDLVSTGGIKHQWVEQYFASMEPLISRVPFFPVLGNHEQNADNYYKYMSLPEPEYYYSFQYGNADFFMIDTNKKCDPDSEQYQWLDKALAASSATWKFVCHHHPPYSSDENDYGNLWKTNKSSRGDLNARHLTSLYDKYKVDIVWNGHIHSYERTWPIKAGKPVDKGGSLYMITGGGGGGLETPGPFRTPFEHLVKRGHHYVMVWINGRSLTFKAYDLDGHLFDTFDLNKF